MQYPEHAVGGIAEGLGARPGYLLSKLVVQVVAWTRMGGSGRRKGGKIPDIFIKGEAGGVGGL